MLLVRYVLNISNRCNIDSLLIMSVEEYIVETRYACKLVLYNMVVLRFRRRWLQVITVSS